MRVEQGAPHVNPEREIQSRSRKNSKAGDGAHGSAASRDSVQISKEGRDLQAERSGLRSEAPSEAEGRNMERILRNLEIGFYDSEEAAEGLAEKLLTAFGL